MDHNKKVYLIQIKRLGKKTLNFTFHFIDIFFRLHVDRSTVIEIEIIIDSYFMSKLNSIITITTAATNKKLPLICCPLVMNL